jgi:Ribbon-helix-helix protein, copG family
VRKSTSATTKTRVTVDLSENLYARLGAMERDTGAGSKADVIRDALRLFEFLVNLAKSGAKFSVTKDGETETIVLLGMPLPESGPASASHPKPSSV